MIGPKSFFLPKLRHLISTLRFVISQKCTELIRIAAGARNHAQRPLFDVTLMFQLQYNIHVCCDVTSYQLINFTVVSEKRSVFVFVVKQTWNNALREVVCC